MSIQFGPLLIGLAVFGVSLGLFLLAFFLARQMQTQRRSQQVMERLSRQPPEGESPVAPEGSPAASAMEGMGRWLEKKRLGSGEDARLLAQAGFRQKGASYLFTALRFLLPALLLILTLILWRLWDMHGRTTFWSVLAAAAIIGYLLPKFVLESMAASRRDALNAELPFFVDMLALLQGVGLSLEQSLFALGQATDLGLPVISVEMRELNRQIAAGRPRLDALQRMADLSADEDLHELVAMLRQIDRYGGDVADALRSYSGRLQEKRQMALREKAGKANVKMTAVMVFANFPALLLITAGPAVLALLHFFDTMG
jgi:tight adherence protein C